MIFKCILLNFPSILAPIPAEYWCVILGATGLVATFILLLVVLLLVAKLLKRDKKAAIWVHHHEFLDNDNIITVAEKIV